MYGAFIAAGQVGSIVSAKGGLSPAWGVGEAHCAAAFLRQWPEGKPDAIVIHLRRAGFKDVPEPGRRELAAWKVFAVTLAELDAIDRAEADERRLAELMTSPAPAPRWPGDLAMQPQPGPFDAAGFSPRR